MRSILYLTGLILLSCTQSDTPVDFQHNVPGNVQPWKHTRFDKAEDKFSFAVFSDLTGGERNGIFEVAVAQLNLLRPELIVNVGDLVEGGKGDTAEWHQQWALFDQRASKARAPIFYMGGNHDLTGQLARDIWESRNGPRYYHFRYKNVLFLVMDTEDNTPARMSEIEKKRLEAVEVYKTRGPKAFADTEYARMPERTSGTISTEQSDYFINAIQENSDVTWTFILIHKPAWDREGETNFAAIEKELADRPYTTFYGHTHVYHYRQRHGRDYINLATTGGEQFPDKGPSFDQIMWVTVSDDGVDLANLKMEGILDKSGHIPLGGDTLVFER